MLETMFNLTVYIIYRGAKRPVYRKPADQKKWNSTSFVVNNVQCAGDEKSILSCPYSTNTECQLPEAVSVVCVMHDERGT